MQTIHNYRNLITPVINRILSRTIKCSKAHNLNASASVEGAIVIPLFIYAVMSIMFIMQVIAVRIHINNAFYVTLRKCAGYVYVYENSGNVPKGMVAETIRRLLIDEIGTDYAADHNIMGGNAGIMFMSSKILNDNSVIDIKLTYSIKNPFEKNIKEICEKEKNVFEQVDKIICLSNSTQNLLSKIYDLPINKFCILYNGLKDESILLNSDKRLNLKKNFLFSKEEKIILFVGRLDEIKGLGELIFTFKKLLQIDPYCHLVIVGDGFYSYYLNSCNPTWNKITFTGKLNKEDLYKLYQIADIGVLPSFHEQCSYVAIEMMMYGIPLVASTSTGLSEMIEDGVSGYHIPIIEYENHTDLNTYELQSKLLILLKDSSMRKEMAKNSRLRYERYYTSEIFSSCMQEFYNRFVL